MKPPTLMAISLIVAGILALVYGQFTYTQETHDAKIGPLDISIKDRETVSMPTWAGVASIVIGGAAASPVYGRPAEGFQVNAMSQSKSLWTDTASIPAHPSLAGRHNPLA